MPTRQPPFYENFDDSHCFQCSFRMGLEYFNPEKTWTWPELEEMTGKKPNLWTWMFKACVELPKNGYQVKLISEIDVESFSKDAKAFINSFFSPEGAASQIKHTDIAAEEGFAAEMLKNKTAIQIEKRQFTVKDLKNLIAEGYVIVPQINPYKIDDQEGYAGHAILIYAVNGDNAVYHDSGKSTAGTAKQRPLAKVVEAALDNGKMEGLIAFKPQKSEHHA